MMKAQKAFGDVPFYNEYTIKNVDNNHLVIPSEDINDNLSNESKIR